MGILLKNRFTSFARKTPRSRSRPFRYLSRVSYSLFGHACVYCAPVDGHPGSDGTLSRSYMYSQSSSITHSEYIKKIHLHVALRTENIILGLPISPHGVIYYVASARLAYVPFAYGVIRGRSFAPVWQNLAERNSSGSPFTTSDG